MAVPKEEIIDRQLGTQEQLMKLLVVMYKNSRPSVRLNPWLGFTLTTIQSDFKRHYGVKLGCSSKTTGLEVAIRTLCTMGLVQVVSSDDAAEPYYDLKEEGVDWGSKIFHSAVKGDSRFASCIERSQNPTAQYQVPLFTPLAV